MERYTCSFDDCIDFATKFCRCKEQPLFLCDKHFENHFDTLGPHLLDKTYRSLDPIKILKVRDAKSHLQPAINTALGYILKVKNEHGTRVVNREHSALARCYGELQQQFLNDPNESVPANAITEHLVRMNLAVKVLLGPEKQRFVVYRDTAMAALTTSIQKAITLERLTQLGQDMVKEPDEIFDKEDPVKWATAEFRGIIKNSQIEVHHLSMDVFYQAHEARANNQLREAITLYRQCADMQKRDKLFGAAAKSLFRLAEVLEEDDSLRLAGEAYLESISMSSGNNSIRSLNDFDQVFENSFLLSAPVHLGDMLESLNPLTGPIPRFRVYEHFIDVLARKHRLHLEYKQILTTLAFAVLYQGYADIKELWRFRLASHDLEKIVRSQVMIRIPSQSRANLYHFKREEVAEYLVASQISSEIFSLEKFNPSTRLNSHEIISKEGVRRFLIEILQMNKQASEKYLMLIVQQTRTRNNITQAAANAITLLNQMDYSFAGEELNNIKITGANLTGGNMTKTNLRGSDLRNTVMNNCKMIGTKLEHANLASAKFDISAVNRHNVLPVYTVCFSFDSSLLAFGTADGTVEIRRTADSRSLSKLLSHTSRVTSVCFSPDASCIVSGSDDRDAIVWDVSQRTIKFLLSGHSDSVTGVTYSPNGTFIGSCSKDRRIMLWAADDGKQLRTLHGHANWVTGLCFSPNSRLLASCSYDAQLILWSPDTGQRYQPLRGHDGGITAVCFSPDGNTIATGGEDRRVILWQVATKQELRKLGGHSSLVTALSYSKNGVFLASGSRDQSVILWEVATSCQIRTLNGQFEAITSLCFSPNNSYIASGSLDGTVVLWKTASGQQPRLLQGVSDGITTACFSRDGELITGGGHPRHLILWKTSTGQQARVIKEFQRATVVNFSWDSSLVVAGNADKYVNVWNIHTGQKLRSFKAVDITSIAFSPDATLVVGGSRNRTVTVWEVTTGRQKYSFQRHSSGVTAICFSPDGSLIASGSRDRSVLIWESATDQQVHALNGHSDEVNTLVFAPHGALLASGGNDQKVILWETETGRQHLTLHKHTEKITGICFSQDGALLASGSRDRSVVVWETATGQQLHVLEGHLDSILALFFISPTRLATLDRKRKFVWTLPSNRTQGFYSADLKTINFETDAGCQSWNVETGERQHPVDIERGPPVVYKQFNVMKVHAVIGSRGFSCYGVKLEGAIISKVNFDRLNERAKHLSLLVK